MLTKGTGGNRNMAYRKRIVSRKEQTALIRLNAIKNFDESNKTLINYGSSGKGLNSGIYQEQIGKCKEIRDEINTSFEKLDGKSNELKKELRMLSNMNTEILSGIRSKFGVDSNEYEQAGGIRQSERKRPLRKKSDVKSKLKSEKLKAGNYQNIVNFPLLKF